MNKSLYLYEVIHTRMFYALVDNPVFVCMFFYSYCIYSVYTMHTALFSNVTLTNLDILVMHAFVVHFVHIFLYVQCTLFCLITLCMQTNGDMFKRGALMFTNLSYIRTTYVYFLVFK